MTRTTQPLPLVLAHMDRAALVELMRARLQEEKQHVRRARVGQLRPACVGGALTREIKRVHVRSCSHARARSRRWRLPT